MKNIESSILGLEHQLDEYGHVKETLSSIHHVLSESALSLVEEYQEGMNEFQVGGLYKKINTVEQLLFYTLIEMKKDNTRTADLLDNLEEILSSDSQEVK